MITKKYIFRFVSRQIRKKTKIAGKGNSMQFVKIPTMTKNRKITSSLSLSLSLSLTLSLSLSRSLSLSLSLTKYPAQSTPRS
jgi:hypothetical protein